MPEPIYRLPPDWTCQVVSTPFAETFDWSLTAYGIPDLWKQTRGKGIRVCVLDTGVDANHPDLRGAIGEARDFTRSMRGAADFHSHGTWCCAMLGARADNNVGVAGIMPECLIFSGKVLGDNGSGTDSFIQAGIRWAMQVDAHIISMSLGGGMMSGRTRDLLQEFTGRPQRFIFAAAGNDGPNSTPNYPGAWSECIAVAAVDRNGNITDFSSRGDYVAIAGPGSDMLSCIPVSMGGYGKMSGTSMATPFVAGVGGLCLAKHIQQGGETGLENVADMKAHLQRTAKDKGVPGKDREYGYGLIDPAALFRGLDPMPPPVVPPIPPIDGELVFDASDFTHAGQAKARGLLSNYKGLRIILQ